LKPTHKPSATWLYLQGWLLGTLISSPLGYAVIIWMLQYEAQSPDDPSSSGAGYILLFTFIPCFLVPGFLGWFSYLAPALRIRAAEIGTPRFTLGVIAAILAIPVAPSALVFFIAFGLPLLVLLPPFLIILAIPSNSKESTPNKVRDHIFNLTIASVFGLFVFRLLFL